MSILKVTCLKSISVLKIQIVAFPKRVCFGSHTEDESGSEKKIPKKVGSSGKVSDLYFERHPA
jgi:hypothetical protein